MKSHTRSLLWKLRDSKEKGKTNNQIILDSGKYHEKNKSVTWRDDLWGEIENLLNGQRKPHLGYAFLTEA